MKVKGTGSRCLLEECVKDNYYARFHPHSYHCCKEMKFIPRLDVNFLDSTQIVDGRTDGRTNGRTNGRKVEPLYRTLLNAGAIKNDHVIQLVQLLRLSHTFKVDRSRQTLNPDQPDPRRARSSCPIWDCTVCHSISNNLTHYFTTDPL